MSVKQGRSGGWDARGVDLYANQYRRHFDLQKDAEKYDTDMRRKRQRGVDEEEERAEREERVAERNITVRDYATKWLARQIHQKDQSIEKLDYSLSLLCDGTGTSGRSNFGPGGRGLGKQMVRAVTIDEMANWMTHLEARGYGVNSRRHAFFTAASLFNAAVKDHIRKASPCEDLDAPPDEGEIIVPTIEEIVALAGKLPAQFRATPYLGAQTGMRPGELLGVCQDRLAMPPRKADIFVTRQFLQGQLVDYLKRPWCVRHLPLDDGTVELLAAHIHDHAFTPDGRLFPATGHFHDNVWKKAVRAAGIERRLRLHDMRHFYATEMLAKYSPKLVAERLGHRNANITLRIYAHVSKLEEGRALGHMAGLFTGIDYQAASDGSSKSRPKRPRGEVPAGQNGRG